MFGGRESKLEEDHEGGTAKFARSSRAISCRSKVQIKHQERMCVPLNLMERDLTSLNDAKPERGKSGDCRLIQWLRQSSSSVVAQVCKGGPATTMEMFLSQPSRSAVSSGWI